MTQLLERVFQKVQALPDTEQNRIARQLLEQLEQAEKHSRLKPRTPGLGKGLIEVSDDFNDPLPDSFWLGEG